MRLIIESFIIRSMPALHYLYAILVAILWGGNFVSSKFGGIFFPPFFFTMLRYVLVAALLLPFTSRPTLLQFKQIAATSTVLCVMHVSLIVTSIKLGLSIPSAAIITQLGVPFSCLLGAILHQDRLGKFRLSGMALAFLGIFIVAGTPNITEHPLAFGVALFSSMGWGISNLQIKAIKGVGVYQISAWMALCAAPQLAIISLLFETNQFAFLNGPVIPALLAVIYTAVGSTVIAYSMWYQLMQKHPVSMVTPFSLLVPVFGIALGQLFFTEALTTKTIVGGLITLGGVAIIVIRRPKLMVINDAV